MKHNVIIIDGIDKVGKTTAIRKIAEQYDNVHIMNNADYGMFANNRRCNIEEFYDNVDHDFVQTVIAPSKLTQLLRTMYMIIDIKPDVQHTFVFDRLFISTLVFSSIFRAENFNKIWKNGSYVNYAEAFEKDIVDASDIFNYLHIVAVRHHDFEFGIEQHKKSTISAESMSDINIKFANAVKRFKHAKTLTIEKGDYCTIYDAVNSFMQSNVES